MSINKRTSLIPFLLMIAILIVGSDSNYDQISQKQEKFNHNFEQVVKFQSQFSTTPDRFWPGGEYWTNPMEDWRVYDGRLESVNSGSDRNIHVLTQALAQIDKNFNGT